MRRAFIATWFFGSLLLAGQAGCSDDSGGCKCSIQIAQINGQDVTVTPVMLTPADDASTEPGFQVDVLVTVSGDCVSDGDEVTLTGGQGAATAVVQGGQARFVGYTIPTDILVELRAEGPSACGEDAKTVKVQTATHDCQFVGLADGQSLSCSNPADDVLPDVEGLQANVGFGCRDVADGTLVTLLRDGEEVAQDTLSGGQVTFPAVFLVGGGADCERDVVLTVQVAGDVFTVTVHAECCGAPGCSIFGYSPSDPLNGFANPNTFNASTDGDTVKAGMQTQVGVETDSSRVWRVGVRVENLDTGEAHEYWVDNITSNQVYVAEDPIDLPEGRVRIQPLCVLQGRTEPFFYPSEAQTVYVDTIPPGCPPDLECEEEAPREASIRCTWTTPDDPGADNDAWAWDFRFATGMSEAQECTEAALAQDWASLDALPGSDQVPGSNYQHQNSYVFSPLDPGVRYCLGVRVVDAAGNESECVASYWLGAIQPNEAWFSPCGQDEVRCGFGKAVAGADLNCDGYKDLVVGAFSKDTDGGAYSQDGAVYVYFGGPNGLQTNQAPDLVIRAPGSSKMSLGVSIAGLGNFTGHAGPDAQCEDVAIGAHLNGYWQAGVPTGAVYLFRGRPTWSATELAPADADAVFAYQDDGVWAIFGFRVANVGDVNGDGVADLAVSAPWTARGNVFVFYGRALDYATGTPAEFVAPADANLVLEGRANVDVVTWAPFCLDNLGAYGLASAGDLDGDGYWDFLVGAPGQAVENQFTRGLCPEIDWIEPRVHIVYGGPGTADSSEILDLAAGSQRVRDIVPDQDGNITATRGLGFAVAGVGDLNGDGFLDLAVSDPLFDSTQPADAEEITGYGALFVFFGNAQGLRGGSPLEVDDADLWIRSNGSGEDDFGISVAVGAEGPGLPFGDFNHDDLADMVVGTARYGTYDGSIWFLYGDSAMVSVQTWIDWNAASFFIPPPAPCGRWGYQVVYLGDTNGDGYVDVAIGDDLFPWVCDTNQGARGRVAVFY